MTQPTNLYSTNDAKGIREDLSDIISNISPVDTPFVSNAGKFSISNTLYEWQTDVLASAVANNAQIEGDDTTPAASVATVRCANYTQISKKSVVVSGTLEAVKKAGRGKELAYQLAKKGKELKRDVETALTSKNVAVSGDDTTARVTAAFDSWLTSNVSNGTSGTNYTITNNIPVTARTDGTDRSFTEALLKTVIAAQWASGGSPDMLMVGSAQKQAFSAFAGIADTRFNAAGAKPATIIGAADIYVSDFGNLDVVPNRFMPTDLAYLIDPEYVAVGYLRPYFQEELAKTGDSEKRQIVVEFGMQMKNQAAHGVVRDLS